MTRTTGGPIELTNGPIVLGAESAAALALCAMKPASWYRFDFMLGPDVGHRCDCGAPLGSLPDPITRELSECVVRCWCCGAPWLVFHQCGDECMLLLESYEYG